MKTGLYDEHLKLNAKIVDFAGWQMPLYYEGALKEHLWVRENVGIFDISHMAKINVEGKDSQAFLNFLSTNDVTCLKDNRAQYAVFCDENGMAVDDAIIYQQHQEKYFVVVNASNREKDLNHLEKYASSYDVEITPLFNDAIIALQGPQVDLLFDHDLFDVTQIKRMGFQEFEYENEPIIIAHTGYTGEKGYEIYGSQKPIIKFWKEALEKHSDVLKPIGLAARDSLRLEMGYVLYGHELSDLISPIESIASWVVKLKKENFLGKKALEDLKVNHSRRSQVGVILDENAIARPGQHVLINGEEKAVVTSGGFSPSLKRSIAIIMVDGILNENDEISVKIRNREVRASKIELPFVKK